MEGQPLIPSGSKQQFYIVRMGAVSPSRRKGIMAGDRNNKMILAAFMQAANCSNYVGSWRHPASDPNFLTAGFYQNIARTLESGKFHFGFIDDRLAMPGRYGDAVDEALRHGVRVVKLDLTPVVMAMTMATRHLGVGATYSATYNAPFNIARLFATMDHFTEGRVGWNVVTSLNDSEAQNFGFESHLDHDGRYDQADETMEIVTGLWDSWEDEALKVDKASGTFADPDKVHRLDYQGEYYKSRGPLTVPRSPQGHPVIMQAGQSSRGKTFAGRWGELVFAVFREIGRGQEIRGELRDRATDSGRDPEGIKVVTATYVIVGETETMAQEKLALAESLANPVDKMALLSELLNFDFSRPSLDQVMTDDDLDQISGSRGMVETIMRGGEAQYPTFGEFIGNSRRGTVHELPMFVGTPKKIADEMEEWFTSEACDGFMVAATHLPGAYEDFVRLVVPELQRRGLAQTEYSGRTLRDHLGLARP